MATAASPTLAAMTCSDIIGVLQPVVRDMRRQSKLNRFIIKGGGLLPLATQMDIAAGAWNPPGAYGADLNSYSASTFVNATVPGAPSQPERLSRDIVSLANDGNSLQSDVQNGGTTYGQPVVSDYRAFEADTRAAARDCGLAPPVRW